jgi:hypothetical protein
MGPKKYAHWIKADIKDEAAMWNAMRVPESNRRTT